MPEGGCLCGKIRLSYTGEAVARFLCHCLDCRKISGATYSNNFVFPEDQFKIESGNPRSFSKIADSGNQITSHFCGDCGTTLYRTGESFVGKVTIKAGVLDDPNWPNEYVPQGELYVGSRVKWCTLISGAEQLPGMPAWTTTY